MINKKIIAITTIAVLSGFLQTPAYANSSWHWLTETTPFDVLPYVVVFTLLIEFILIKVVNSITGIIKPLVVICLANLASFLLPYVKYLLPSAIGYSFEMSINHLPVYIIGTGYLVLTLAVEVLIVYFCLRKTAGDNKKLLISIIAVNTATTLIVVGVERIFIKGSWL